MDWREAARLRGLIQAYVEASVAEAISTEAEVHAGALDEDVRMAKEKLLAFIREHTDSGRRT